MLRSRVARMLVLGGAAACLGAFAPGAHAAIGTDMVNASSSIVPLPWNRLGAPESTVRREPGVPSRSGAAV